MALPEGVKLPNKAKVLSEGMFNGNSTPTQEVNVEHAIDCIRRENSKEDEHTKTDVFFYEEAKNIFYFAVYEHSKEKK